VFRIVQNNRPPDEIRIFHHQIDGLLLGQLSRTEVARFVGGAALVEKVVQARLVDQALEQLARRRLFRQIMFYQLDAFVLEEGDRLPTARSTRLEVDVQFFHERSDMILPEF
jgi:hypothetical protein